MCKAKYDYLMDRASDKETFQAVMFACEMIRKGKNAASAIRTASKYYDVDMEEVAHLVGQRGGRKNAEKVSSRAIKKKIEDEKLKQKQKARKLELAMIKSHDGKPFFISHEEKRLADETGISERMFRNAREDMKNEGVLEWETLKDEDGHVIGTWFNCYC